MSKKNNLTDFLTDIADAIRSKKGTKEKINPQNFSDEIRKLETAKGIINITKNGIVDVKKFEKAKVNVEPQYIITLYGNEYSNKKHTLTEDEEAYVKSIIIEGEYEVVATQFSSKKSLNYFNVSTRSVGNIISRICYGGFSFCEGLESVDLGDGTCIIEEEAFYKCPSLIYVFGDSVVLSNRSFMSCYSLSRIPSVENEVLPQYIFTDCYSLQDLDMSSWHTKELGVECFTNSYIKNLTLSTRVTKIEARSLNRCYTLETIHFGGLASEWNNIEFNGLIRPAKSKKTGNEYQYELYVKSINGLNGQIKYNSKLVSLSNDSNVLSDDVSGEISPYAFSYISSLESFFIGNGAVLTKIGAYAFYKSNIKLLSLDYNRTELLIDQYAFSYCKLENLNLICNGRVKFGNNCFSNNDDLKTVSITRMTKNHNYKIPDDMFMQCKSLKIVNIDFDIPNAESIDSHIGIGIDAFYDCVLLESINFTVNQASNFKIYGLYARAFYNCYSLTSFDLKGVKQVQESAFEIPTGTSNIAEFTLEGSYRLEIVFERAFSNRRIIGVINLENLVEAEEYAFSGCAPTKVIFGPNLQTLGALSFWFTEPCIFDLRTLSHIPSIESNSINYTKANTIIVPDSLYDDFVANTVWNKGSNQIVKASDYLG